MKTLRHLATVSLILSSLVRAALGQVIYLATDISPPGSSTTARGLNDWGTVVGQATVSGTTFAFSYSNGNWDDLGTFSGDGSAAYAVNGAGTVVGSYSLPDVGLIGFIYSNGTETDVNALGGAGDTNIYAINDSGTLVGSSSLPSGGVQAFSSSNGTATDLGALKANGYSAALAINGNGMVVGTSVTSGGYPHAVVFSTGGLEDLGTLGGAASYAYGVNDSGTIVGISQVGNGHNHAFEYSMGTMSDLGTLGGTYSNAYAINNSGVVVGSATIAGDREFDAFVDVNGTMSDLNSMVTLTGVDLYEGVGINGLGQIITDGGDGQSYLLSPVLAPTTVDPLSSNANWAIDAGQTFGNGSLIFQNGRSEYIVASPTAEDGTQAVPVPGANGSPMTYGPGGTLALVGSVASDWTAQVNIYSSEPALGASQAFTASLAVYNLQDAHYDNGAQLFLDAGTGLQPSRVGAFTWGNTLSQSAATTATEVTVLASYSSTTRNLSFFASQDQGNTWLPLLSFDVTQSNANGGWGMDPFGGAASFGISLWVNSSATTGVGPVVTSGSIYYSDFACAGLSPGNWPQYVPAPVAPTITEQPLSSTGTVNGGVTLTVSASGAPAPTYQWYLNGVALGDGLQLDGSIVSGSATAILSFSLLQADENGASLTVAATNTAGSATSAAATLTVSAQADGQLYTAVNLGTLGGSQAFASDLNGAGIVVGYATTAGDAATHAFSYGDYEMTDLGTLGGVNSYAYGINNEGVIVGNAGIPNIYSNGWAFSYSDGTMTPLDMYLGGSNDAQAWAINDAGVIVGHSFIIGQGFINDNGSVTLLPTLGGSNSSPTGINNSGTVVGSSNDATGNTYGFTYSNGVMTSLGALDGATFSEANGINNAGTIVGFANDAATGYYYAFSYSNGTMTSLGTLGGYRSSASGINDTGTIVGWSNVPSGGQDAFIYSNGVMADLNPLAGLAGVTLTQANAINAGGQIIAEGSDNQAYLLTPIPGAEPGISGQPASQSAAANASATFSVSGSGADLTYQWYLNGVALTAGTQADGSTVLDAGSSSLSISNLQSDEDGASLTVVVSNALGSVTSSAAALTVVAAPAITSQPVDQTVLLGASAAFSVATSDVGDTFQWQFNGANIPGATGPTLQIPATAPALTGHYDVVLSNASGSTTSAIATLYINDPLASGLNWTGTYSSEQSYEVFQNGRLEFNASQAQSWETQINPSVGANGAPQVDGLSSDLMGTMTADWSVQLSVHGSALPVGPTQGYDAWLGLFNMQAGQYYNNGSLYGLDYNNAGQDGVPPLASIQDTNWSSGPYLSFPTPATDIVLRAAYTSSTHLLAKEYSTDGGATWTTTSSFDVTQTDDNGGWGMTVTGGPSFGICFTVDGDMVLTSGDLYFTNFTYTGLVSGLWIPTAAYITAQPSPVTVASGGTAVFSAAAIGGGALQYQWYLNGVALTDGGNISGSQTATLTLTDVGVSEAGSYTVVVNNGTTATSVPAELTVLGPPVIVTQPAGLSDIGGVTVFLGVVATGTPSPTYQWQSNGANVAGATGATLDVSLSAATAGSYTVIVSNSQGSVTSSPAVLALDSGYAFTTLAGKAGVAGSKNGTGAAARFNYPQGSPAVDLSGNLYVADGSNNTIRKITPAGAVTTLAGTAGVTGSADGTGAAAQFNSPFNVAVDAGGNIYVADSGNGTIREVSPAGVVTTIAGTAGTTGSADGVGAAAQFNVPAGIAVDANGNVYVGDFYNCTIRKITPTVSGGPTVWTVTTIAGTVGVFGETDGPGLSATFSGSTGLYAVANGNIYVQDNGGCTRLLEPSVSGGVTTWQVTTIAGIPASTVNYAVGQVDGPGPDSLFAYPGSLAVDNQGNVFVADSYNNVVREITPTVSNGVTSWTVTTLAGDVTTGQKGGSANGTGAGAQFSGPTGVSVDATGRLYVTDSENDEIRVGTSSSFTGAPVITTQPLSQTVVKGSSATFTVTAQGNATLAYQWALNGTALSGATKATLTVNNVKAANEGTYTVTVSNSAGSATSAGAVLTVDVAPAITAQPASLTVVEGTSATFTVVATGNPAPTYQWYLGGNLLPGATSSSLTLANVQPANAGSYTVIVSNPLASVTSKAATLTVDTPPTIMTQPVSQTVVAGTDVTFTVAASGNPAPKYQWSLNGSAIAGATKATLTINNVKAASSGAYTVVATNSSGSATSGQASLTVIVPPAITTQPKSQTVTAGSAVAFSVVATGTPTLTYQWTFDGTPIPGATAPTLTLTDVQSGATGNYSVTVTNDAGDVTSKTATLNVK